MAYESPIKIDFQEGIPDFRTFHREINEKLECRIVASVQEKLAIEIDKPELLKALRYDRNQYEVGFAYGYRQGVRDTEEKQTAQQEADAQEEWISVSERLPDKQGRCLVFTDYGDVTMDSFIDGMFVCNLGNVTHWRPLPQKPYKESEEE